MAARNSCLVLLLAVTLSSCGGGSPPAEKTTNSEHVVKNPGSTVAVVFVHGLFGDALETWTHPNKTTFFDHLNASEGVAGKTDMFAFGFPSSIFGNGSFNIGQAADRLHLHLDGFSQKYRDIVFVAHSMGGLVVLHELLKHADLRDRVPVIVLFGTPQQGSDISNVASLISKNRALVQMESADSQGALSELADAWKTLPLATRPRILCAYESMPTLGVQVVSRMSATAFCDDASPAIAANHIDMVKPDQVAHDAVRVAARALEAEVFDRRLETPDFRTEGDTAVLTLANVGVAQSAKIRNAGRARLRVSASAPPDQLLHFVGETTKPLAPGQTDYLFLVLGFGATADEYSIVLESNASKSPMPVTVRVPDLATVRAQQAELVRQVAAGIESALNDPATGARLRAAGPTDTEAPAALVSAARRIVARLNPGLPESAQWLIAAEALNATNWPGLAATALREAERVDPAVARTPQAQRLAGKAAALSGEARVFQTAPTPQLSAPDVSALGDGNLLVGANADRAMKLALQLKAVPALAVLGLSLEGDVEKARGNAAAASQSFEQAAAIRPSPSVTRRLDTVKTPSRQTPGNQTPAGTVTNKAARGAGRAVVPTK